ncbi:HD domain-containing protein [Aliarcobacter butzleri]|uniref:HD domain-containing protein n=1 Tax=Aliarcobacter butzleri TaxID=28197 RepID=A0AAW6VQG2_9BACT|nr:HD domain-containing phosphohydrolase [Aliarcobacter butzleri]MDK2062842.1 HD domain-containing protein [Aliarcobacter butzleri]
MTFNLNQFLLALSDALDFVEIDTLGSTAYHSKRVSYISLRLAEYFNLNDAEKFDLCSFSILHDNGLSEETLIIDSSSNPKKSNHNQLEQFREHCDIGEKNVKNFPFLTDHKNIIKYHHENYDGSGFFGLKGDEIPLLAQIIALADTVDNLFHFENPSIANRKKIIEFINKNENIYYSPKIVEYFNILSQNTAFWLDLQSVKLEDYILNRIESFIIEVSYDELIKISSVFSHIVDSNSTFTAVHSSGLSQKVEILSKFYNFDSNKVKKMIIAANLHDIGKLAIPNSILDKNGKLTEDEYAVIKSHTYYTRVALEKIDGFEEITDWAANHHEKLDGKGYPYGLSSEKISFECRLMGCLDMYQALTENRPYRAGLTHEKTVSILYEHAEKGYIDSKIVKDIDIVFR